MKTVLKCDFCYTTKDTLEVGLMITHESNCVFNPINKKCFTCKHYYDEYGVTMCDVNENALKGEEEGNCPQWEGESA